VPLGPPAHLQHHRDFEGISQIEKPKYPTAFFGTKKLHGSISKDQKENIRALGWKP